MHVELTPSAVNLAVTQNCNAKCSFCYVAKKEAYSPFEEIKAICDHLHTEGVLRVNLFGGEPFLHPNIREIIDYLHQLGFFISGVTNGLLLKESLLQFIKGKVEVLGVSLHGLGDSHEHLTRIPGSFRRVVAGITRASHLGIAVGINYTVTSQNFSEIRSTVEYLANEGVDLRFIALNAFIADEANDPRLEPTMKQLNDTLATLAEIEETYPALNSKYAISFPLCWIEDRRHFKYVSPCGYGKNHCAVDHRGNVRPCSYSKIELGNVNKDTLSHLWRNHDFLVSFRKLAWLDEACGSCRLKNQCLGGCFCASGEGRNLRTKIYVNPQRVEA